MITIGTLDHRPICLSYGYCQINNKKILVWGLTSELVDYKMAEKWLKTNCTEYREGKRCDAANFHNILNA